jgi:nitroreductase
MVKDGQYIKEVLDLARLAPSSHNTQPWKVFIRGSKLIVGYEPVRQLSVGDPDKRELFISLGCFIQTTAEAAASYGYEMSCLYIGDGNEGVAELLFVKKGPAKSVLSDAIRDRRSDRRLYQKKPIPPAELKALSGLTSGAATVAIYDSEADIRLISELTGQATMTAMKRGEFREELAGWIRNNWTKQPDGMPAYVQGIPGPVSLIAKSVIKTNPKVAGSQAKKDAKSILNSAAIALITLKKENPRNWVDAGRLYQKIWLQATRAGISSAAFSAAVVDKDTAAVIRKSLKLDGQPVALLRLGYIAGQPKASPRRRLSDILS